MNKKIILPFIALLLGACNININTSTSSSSPISTNHTTSYISPSEVSSTTLSSSSSTVISSTITDPNEDEFYDGYYKANTQDISYKEVRQSYVYKADLPSSGNPKMLVIPVRFKDSNYADTHFDGYTTIREDLEKVFFGDSDETGWESVRSFYQKSSYGKLNIEGKVSEWFTSRYTVNQVASNREYMDPSILILREAIEWYKLNHDDINDFDSNGDLRIDSVWLVYDYPAKSKIGIDWAYTYWDINNYDYSYGDPAPYAYAWASIDFMYNGNYVDLDTRLPLTDAHTYIHETGHLLGLPDFYDYDSKSSPAGGLDMMDHNIGDHSAYSKYVLGWTNPYVVNGDCTITIRPFESSGDFILIKDEWNHSALDEYLLIEFYTPTGLNKLDSESQYAGSYPRHFTIPGIKVSHVDARLVWYSGNQYQGYTDEVIASGTSLTVVGHSNTASQSYNKDYRLVTLLENGGTNYFTSSRRNATNDTLFIEGDYFDPMDFNAHFTNDEAFNDGEFINYMFTIDSITDEGATISFITLNNY